jgi:hypothetical protein
MASDVQRLQTATKLIAMQRELLEKLQAVGEELDAVLGGKATIGDKLRQVCAAFDTAWGQRYAGGQTGRYVWNRGPDMAALKRLLKTLTAEELEARAVRYVSDEDRFLSQRRHPFQLFASGVNKYALANVDVPAFALEAPGDCRHVPPCRDDVEHTKRRAGEMRA